MSVQKHWMQGQVLPCLSQAKQAVVQHRPSMRYSSIKSGKCILLGLERAESSTNTVPGCACALGDGIRAPLATHPSSTWPLCSWETSHSLGTSAIINPESPSYPKAPLKGRACGFAQLCRPQALRQSVLPFRSPLTVPTARAWSLLFSPTSCPPAWAACLTSSRHKGRSEEQKRLFWQVRGYSTAAAKWVKMRIDARK